MEFYHGGEITTAPSLSKMCGFTKSKHLQVFLPHTSLVFLQQGMTLISLIDHLKNKLKDDSFFVTVVKSAEDALIIGRDPMGRKTK